MGRRILSIVVGINLLALVGVAQADTPRGWATVTVQTGDTLTEIAKRENIPLHKLASLNGITNPDVIRAGQRLKTHPLALRSTAATPERQSRRSSEDTLWITHRVRSGDTLWAIGKKYNVKARYLIQNNGLSRANLIRPGNEIRVKKRVAPMLADGVQLPDGEGYVRLRPTKAWGTRGTVRLIQRVYKQFSAQYPKSVPGYVADLSKKDGGHLRPHRSHQRGVDVDISYYKKKNKPTHGLEVVTPQSIDIAKTWDLIRHFLNTRHVPAIFMDYELQRTLHEHLVALGYSEALRTKILQYPRSISTRKGIIRHSPGHHHHLHVRFDCLKSTESCSVPETTWIAARAIPEGLELAPAALAVRQRRRSQLEPVVAPAIPIAEGEEKPPETRGSTDAPPTDEAPRIVRAQESESHRPLPALSTLLEEHWLDLLRKQRKVEGVATKGPGHPLGVRTPERASRSGRLGPSASTTRSKIDTIQ